MAIETYSDASPDFNASADATTIGTDESILSGLTAATAERKMSAAELSQIKTAEAAETLAKADYEIQERQKQIDLVTSTYGASSTDPAVVTQKKRMSEITFHEATPGFM